MRIKFIQYLTDPVTNENFETLSFKEEDGHIVSGLLIAPRSWYPIIDGVPRMLTGELKINLLQKHIEFFKKFNMFFPEEISNDWGGAIKMIQDLNAFLRHQEKTGESFAFEWKYIYKENAFEKNNFFHFLGPFIKEDDFKDKITLDVGCGSGRFTKWAALCRTKASFGVDLGESVDAAYLMTKNIENVCIIQADIYALPFYRIFDLAYSIGVIHHLPDPKNGFLKLPTVLNKNGQLAVWVYNRRNNKRALYLYEPMRSVFKKLPKPLLFKLCYLPAFGVHLMNYVTNLFKAIGMKKFAESIPFSYYSNFPFNMKLNDAFDVLATPKSNYYYVEEIKRWFSDASLREVEAHEHYEAGITCIGKYAQT